MTLKNLPALIFCAAMLAGCASDDVIQTSGDLAALPAFKTFKVSQEQFVFATEASSDQRDHVSQRLRAAVVSALQGRGYREAEDADVLVALGAMSRPKLSEDMGSSNSNLHPVNTSVLDPGQPAFVPTSDMPIPDAGREGDLFLELLDPKTQKLLWHASSSGSATTPREALSKARKAYAAMVEKLPKAAP